MTATRFQVTFTERRSYVLWEIRDTHTGLMRSGESSDPVWARHDAERAKQILAREATAACRPRAKRW